MKTKFSIRDLTRQACQGNRASGWNMNGTADVYLRAKDEQTGNNMIICLVVRAFGPFCTMSYYVDGKEVSYQDACKVIRDDSRLA